MLQESDFSPPSSFPTANNTLVWCSSNIFQEDDQTKEPKSFHVPSSLTQKLTSSTLFLSKIFKAARAFYWEVS